MRALFVLLAFTAAAHAQGAAVAPPINRLGPEPVAGLGRASAIADVYGTSCALVDGAVWCWGRMDAFAEQAPDSATPAKLPRLSGIVQLSIGPTGGCGCDAAGVVSCWGPSFDLVKPAHIKGLGRVKKVSVGAGFACALLVDGHVACWGINYDNELGQPLAVPRKPRAAITPALLGRPRKITATVVEPIGMPKPSPEPYPKESPAALRVPGVDRVVDLAAGKSHACAVRASGEVLCWGDRHVEREEGRTIRTGELHRIPGLDDAVAVNGEDRASCALRRGGRVSCWAENSDEDPLTGPCEYALEDAVALSDHGAYAVKRTGEIVFVTAWRSCERTKPERDLADVVEAGEHCALIKDGRVVCWGTNEHGELGRPPAPLFK